MRPVVVATNMFCSSGRYAFSSRCGEVVPIRLTESSVKPFSRGNRFDRRRCVIDVPHNAARHPVRLVAVGDAQSLSFQGRALMISRIECSGWLQTSQTPV